MDGWYMAIIVWLCIAVIALSAVLHHKRIVVDDLRAALAESARKWRFRPVPGVMNNDDVDLDSTATDQDTRSRAYRLGHQDGWWLSHSGVTHENPADDAQRCDPYKELDW